MGSYTLLVEELEALASTPSAHARVRQCAVPAVEMQVGRAFDGTSSNRAAAVTMSGTTTSVPVLGTHRREREPREGGL